MNLSGGRCRPWSVRSPTTQNGMKNGEARADHRFQSLMLRAAPLESFAETPCSPRSDYSKCHFIRPRFDRPLTTLAALATTRITKTAHHRRVASADGRRQAEMDQASPPAKTSFLMTAWTPQLPSTTWVMR